MYLSQIQATALKGRSFTHALQPLTLICGRNFTGKTSIIEAIRLAVLGHIPELGKTNAATWALASGNTMSVKSTFDNGDYLSRVFRVVNGKIKEEPDSSMDEEDIDALVTASLNASEYFEQGPTDRIKYIAAKMKLPDTYTVEGILAGLPRTDEQEQAWQIVTTRCEEKLRELGVADGLSLLVDSKGPLGIEETAYAKEAKQCEGAVLILSELSLREDECSAHTLADLADQITHLEAQLGEANRASGRLTEAWMQYNRVVMQRNALQAALDKPSEDPTDQIEALKAEIEELRKGLTADPRAMQQEGEELDKRLSILEKNSAVAEAEIHRLMGEQEELQKAITEETPAVCPTCGSSNKKIQAALRKGTQDAIAKNAEAVADLNRKWAKYQDETAPLLARKMELVNALGAASTIEREIAAKSRKLVGLQGYKDPKPGIREQLAALAEQVEPAPVAEVSARVQQLVTQLGEAKARHSKALALEQDLKRAREAKAKHDAAEANPARAQRSTRLPARPAGEDHRGAV
jgi:DNA repair exonuclease SbcCD ATPase subunit